MCPVRVPDVYFNTDIRGRDNISMYSLALPDSFFSMLKADKRLDMTNPLNTCHNYFELVRRTLRKGSGNARLMVAVSVIVRTYPLLMDGVYCYF